MMLSNRTTQTIIHLVYNKNNLNKNVYISMICVYRNTFEMSKSKSPKMTVISAQQR